MIPEKEKAIWFMWGKATKIKEFTDIQYFTAKDVQAIIDMDDTRLKQAWVKMSRTITDDHDICGIQGNTCIFCIYHSDHITNCGKCEYGKTHGICGKDYMNSWSKIKEIIRMHNNNISYNTDIIFSNQFYNNLLDKIEKAYLKNK